MYYYWKHGRVLPSVFYKLPRGELLVLQAFYEQEIMYRELMDYPPVSNLLTVKVSSKNEQLANDTPVAFTGNHKGIKKNIL